MQAYTVATSLFELLAILAGFYCINKLALPYKLLLLQVFLAFVNDIVAWAVQKYAGYNNVLLYNIYTVIEVWLLGSACWLLLTSSNIRQVVKYLIPCLTIVWIIITIVNGINVFNNWTVITNAIFYIIFYLVLLIDNSIFNHKKLYKQPLFLIAMAIIIYYATIIPLFGLMNYLTSNNMQLAGKLFKINFAAAILRYALVAIAFYLYGRQAKRAYVRE
ncbi:MAG TPA: hypothetical protein VIN07_10185 [Flavipsychrobacter sp.]